MSKTVSVEKHEPLKTCPMCRGKADYNWDEVGPNAERHWYIHCAPDDSFKGCISHDGRFATLREAVTHWNTRKADCHEELDLALAALNQLSLSAQPCNETMESVRIIRSALARATHPQPDEAKPALSEDAAVEIMAAAMLFRGNMADTARQAYRALLPHIVASDEAIECVRALREVALAVEAFPTNVKVNLMVHCNFDAMDATKALTLANRFLAKGGN